MHNFLFYLANRFHVKKQFSMPVTLCFFDESKMALRCQERRRNVTPFTFFRFVLKSVMNNSFENVINTIYALSSIQNSLK